MWQISSCFENYQSKGNFEPQHVHSSDLDCICYMARSSFKVCVVFHVTTVSVSFILTITRLSSQGSGISWAQTWMPTKKRQDIIKPWVYKNVYNDC